MDAYGVAVAFVALLVNPYFWYTQVYFQIVAAIVSLLVGQIRRYQNPDPS